MNLWLSSTYSYRPQTKFAKVMFLHGSVNLSTAGEMVIPACIAGEIKACPVGILGGAIPACLVGLQAHIKGGI